MVAQVVMKANTSESTTPSHKAAWVRYMGDTPPIPPLLG